jgi:hypothetical protein
MRSMERASRCLLATGIVVCAGQVDAQGASRGRLSPWTLTVTASTRVLSETDSAPSLEVSTLLENRTPIHIRVVTGAQCPLFVQVVPNPTGELAFSTASRMRCKTGRALDLAPGKRTTLRRVLRADTLAHFPPGRYGVSAVVTTGTDLIGAWAGSVELPLRSAH